MLNQKPYDEIKLVLVDLDGVILTRPDYFSNRAKSLYPNANHEAILEFFTGGVYKNTTLGKRNLVDALSEVLPSWGVTVSVEEVLKTWFEGEGTINRNVLEKIQKIRQEGVACVIVTDHSKYRKDNVWNNLGMKDYFDGIVASADIGATKDEVAFYKKSVELFGIENLDQVVFVDDDPKNVAVANEVGVRGVLFEGVQSLTF